jgi:hypothetical protein
MICLIGGQRMASMYLAGPEEAEFTKAVNARLDRFLKELRGIEDLGEGKNIGNVDRRDLTIRFVEDINELRR